MNSNKAMMARRSDAVPRGVGQIHPIFAERAENCRVWDVEGREYLDFAGGIAVLNTGHLHPQIVAAVEDQLKKLSHTCFQVLAYEPYLALCEKMNQKVPGDFAKKTLLVTTGSEAVENAVKIARAATGRSGAIAFTGAYHGRTHYTLSLTGKVNPYSAGMGLMPGHVYRALYPCALHGVSDDEAIASIHRIFKNDAAPEDIAAIIIEPVQGEGGFYAASPAFMQRLRALCDEHGIMLIADEVQSGAGRTGTLFAMEQMGVARWMISSALTMVIAQRLVRRLCPHCRRETRDQAQLPRSVWPRPLPRWQPTGCDRCYHGFYGRVAIFEVLAIDNALRQAIASGAGTDVIEASARQAGMVSLFEHGCRAVEQGLTTIEELLRVLGMPNGG